MLRTSPSPQRLLHVPNSQAYGMSGSTLASGHICHCRFVFPPCLFRTFNMKRSTHNIVSYIKCLWHSTFVKLIPEECVISTGLLFITILYFVYYYQLCLWTASSLGSLKSTLVETFNNKPLNIHFFLFFLKNINVRSHSMPAYARTILIFWKSQTTFHVTDWRVPATHESWHCLSDNIQVWTPGHLTAALFLLRKSLAM